MEPISIKFRHLPNRTRRLRLEIEQFLGDLGPDSGAVADRLRRDGIRGVRKSTHDCAVARYLNAVLAADLRICTVEVTRDWIVIRRAGRRCIQVALPPSVREFVAIFDDGSFSDLVEIGSPLGSP